MQDQTFYVDQEERKITTRFAVMLKHERKRQGLSLQRLGELTGMSASYIHRVETTERQNPSLTVVLLLAKALEFTPYQLFNLFIDVDGDWNATPSLEELLMAHEFTIGETKIDNVQAKQALIKMVELVVYEMSEKVTIDDASTLSKLVSEFHSA
ncbi:helix-turn-helix domain-containing protein [Alkalibacillus salilacus]|uniref:Transcriptional regulator with XRE-family HTH domain n=1 Tax=Alkalibacillus salilacus TaxID=284582 RepID=A0ABT9VIG2_9BACI|nr:transcriptional regulator [Alkalibacillus salilacus]MDQ0160750.1 transcriptional regulator with XRE-family HTH domain [Alkalibacillus salilacus]